MSWGQGNTGMVRRVDQYGPWCLVKEFRLNSEGTGRQEKNIKLNTLPEFLQVLTLGEPQISHPDSDTQNEPNEILLQNLSFKDYAFWGWLKGDRHPHPTAVQSKAMDSLRLHKEVKLY